MSDVEKHIALKYMGYKNATFITLNQTNYDPLLPYIAGVEFVFLETVPELDSDYNENANRGKEEEKQMKCFICHKVVGTTWYVLLKHCAKEHFNEAIQCSQCSSQFANPQDLEKHMDEHKYSSHTVYVCPYCDGRFRSPTSLERHETNCKVLRKTVITRTNQGLPLEGPTGSIKKGPGSIVKPLVNKFESMSKQDTSVNEPRGTPLPGKEVSGMIDKFESMSKQDTRNNEPRGTPSPGKDVSGMVNRFENMSRQDTRNNEPRGTPSPGREVSGFINKFESMSKQDTRNNEPRGTPSPGREVSGFINKFESMSKQDTRNNEPRGTPSPGREVSGFINKFESMSKQDTRSNEPRGTPSPGREVSGFVNKFESMSRQDTSNNEPRGTPNPGREVSGAINRFESWGNQDTRNNEPRGAPSPGREVSGLISRFESGGNQDTRRAQSRPIPTTRGNVSGMINRFNSGAAVGASTARSGPITTPRSNNFSGLVNRFESGTAGGGRNAPPVAPRSRGGAVSAQIQRIQSGAAGAGRNPPPVAPRSRGGEVSAHIQRFESGGATSSRPNTTQNPPGRSKVMKRADYFESNPMSYQASGAKPQPGYSRNPARGNSNRNAAPDEKWWNDAPVEKPVRIDTYRPYDYRSGTYYDRCVPKSTSFNVDDCNFGIDNFNDYSFPLRGTTNSDEELISTSDTNVSYNFPPTDYNQHSSYRGVFDPVYNQQTDVNAYQQAPCNSTQVFYKNRDDIMQQNSYRNQVSSYLHEPIQVVTSRGVSYQDHSSCGVPRYIADSYGNNGENAVHISFSSGGYDYDIEVSSQASINVTAT